MRSVSPGGILLSAHEGPLVPSGHAGSHDALLLGVYVAIGAMLVVASVVATNSSWAPEARRRARSTLGRARRLTPEKIVAYEGRVPDEDTPGRLSRRIVERSEEIRRALGAGLSEVEVAMCAMGYSACADDLLALIELAGARLPEAGPFRRLAILAHLRRATRSLALARRAFPARARAAPPARDRGKDA